jgi:hypothetical protein
MLVSINKGLFDTIRESWKPDMTTQCLTRMNFFLHSVVLHYITNLKKKRNRNFRRDRNAGRSRTQ